MFQARTRWIILIPAVVSSWVLVFLVSSLIYVVADTLCPSKYQVSGHCIAGIGGVVMESIIVLGASASAVVVILVVIVGI